MNCKVPCPTQIKIRPRHTSTQWKKRRRGRTYIFNYKKKWQLGNWTPEKCACQPLKEKIQKKCSQKWRKIVGRKWKLLSRIDVVWWSLVTSLFSCHIMIRCCKFWCNYCQILNNSRHIFMWSSTLASFTSFVWILHCDFIFIILEIFVFLINNRLADYQWSWPLSRGYSISQNHG